jgi:hypothetical protein
VPSAEEATEDQFVIGALLCIHVAPEFVETKIGPRLPGIVLSAAATSLVPSAEHAMDVQFVFGAVVNLQSAVDV